MGVSGGGDVLHKVPGLKLEHLANACLPRAQQNSRSSVCAVVDVQSTVSSVSAPAAATGGGEPEEDEAEK